jgi:Leucine-rich repeat (LRR) protein
MQAFEGVAVSAATSTAAAAAESSVAFASASASVSTPAGAAESSSPSGLSGRLHAIRSIKRGITLAAQSSFLSASASASASAATEASGGGSGGGTGAGIRVSRSGEGLRSFPLELVTEELVARLCVLDLSRNVLSVLPTVIGCFTQLQQLELQHNALRVLSPQLGSLQMLTCLRLSHNVLTELPGELGQLARLRVLDLAENQLGGVPLPARAFKGLTSLELLDLSANQLAFDSFPRDLPWEHLASLQRLKLRANRLGALPPLHRLPALRRLQLKGNPLQALPFSLEQLRSSRDVARHVLEYCRSLYEGGEADWRFLRVLFIGREGAGRSSLIRLLRAATSSSSSSSLSIPSSLSSSSFSSFSASFTSASSSGSGVGTGDGVGEVEGGAPHLPQLAAWPALLQTPVLAEWGGGGGGGGGAGSEEGPIVFALQEVPAGSAEAAAPLLFTERAVYVFVFRATESAASLLPWLEAQLRLVRATIGDSVHPPLLLVATHLDQASPEHLAALWAEMQERVFPRVPFRRSSLSPENCLAVSCRNKKGLKELQARLRDVALRGEGLLRRRVPTSWKALLAAVRSTRAQLPHTHSAAAGAPAPPAGMLHWSEWETLARSCNVDASSLAPATQLLHDAGELWHAESPRELADLVFLEPRAVLEVFAHVPRSTYVKGGLLHHRFLPQMFARYPAPLHAPLLRLLERAQLVLPWKCAADGTQHSLVPLLLTEKPDANLDFVLPSNGPSYTWFLERRYEFPYAAVGFFPRLIVRVLASLKEVSAYHIWRNALALVVNSTDQQGYVHYCNSASGAMLIIRVVSLSYTLREKFFSQLVACVEALLVSFYSSLLQNTRRFAVCSHCLAILRRSPTSTPASAPAPAAPPLQPTVFELTELSARLVRHHIFTRAHAHAHTHTPQHRSPYTRYSVLAARPSNPVHDRHTIPARRDTYVQLQGKWRDREKTREVIRLDEMR